jgi:hypothetical protein
MDLDEDVTLTLCANLLALMREAAELKDLVCAMAADIPIARMPEEQRRLLTQTLDEWGT